MAAAEASTPQAAPVLSTPESHIFDSYSAAAAPTHSTSTDDDLRMKYQIQWTASEIRAGRWRRVALQFPDGMLPDAPRIYELLKDNLRSSPRDPHAPTQVEDASRDQSPQHEALERDFSQVHLSSQASVEAHSTPESLIHGEEQLYILGDTSYGACCIDEIAAEHVSADAVVHYGRACLSPTVRLPVLHVFTIQPLNIEAVLSSFEATYPNLDTKVLLVADVTYSSHVPSVSSQLQERGYTNIFATEVEHNPSSLIPNRTVPPNLPSTSDGESPLADWHLFHISSPPSALTLTLASRVSSIRVFPTDQSTSSSTVHSSPSQPSASLATPMPLLRRRYALLTKLRTAAIIGILINTLSASSTLPLLAHLRNIIAAAEKKSYTVVVGKVNAAKLANFAEVDGWVVVGCWESSLLDDSEGKGGSGWWKPCVTPWELEAALGPEGSGMAGWRTDLESLLERAAGDAEHERQQAATQTGNDENPTSHDHEGDLDAGPLADEEESEPPEFDLRTGRYVSTSRPMRQPKISAATGSGSDGNNTTATTALMKKARADLAVINGQASPGAAFLREKRTWRGLGTDFEIAYEDDDDGVGADAGAGGRKGGLIEEGRSGLARGYGEERS